MSDEELKKEVEEKNDKLFNIALLFFIGLPISFFIAYWVWFLYEASKL